MYIPPTIASALQLQCPLPAAPSIYSYKRVPLPPPPATTHSHAQLDLPSELLFISTHQQLSLLQLQPSTNTSNQGVLGQLLPVPLFSSDDDKPLQRLKQRVSSICSYEVEVRPAGRDAADATVEHSATTFNIDLHVVVTWIQPPADASASTPSKHKSAASDALKCYLTYHQLTLRISASTVSTLTTYTYQFVSHGKDTDPHTQLLRLPYVPFNVYSLDLHTQQHSSQHQAIQQLPDKAFCHKLPKIELHAHLSGSIPPSTLLNIVEKRQSSDSSLSAEHQDVYQRYIQLLQSITQDQLARRSLQQCFDVFALVHTLVDNLQTLSQVSEAVVRGLAADNVVYAELRTTPRKLAATHEEATADHPTVQSQAAYVQTVCKVLQQMHGQSQLQTVDGLPMTVRLILSVDRRHSIEEAVDTVELAHQCITSDDTAYRAADAANSSYIVGIDFSGNPNVNTFNDFKPAFDLAKQYNIKTTVHCAEVHNEEDTAAILAYQPDRVGHAVLMDDKNWQQLYDSRIPVEICPTSNLITLACEHIHQHPFGTLYKRQHPLAICTDDSGVFGQSLSDEYQLIAGTFSLSKQQMYDVAYSSVAIAFAGDDVKSRVRDSFKQWRDSNLHYFVATAPTPDAAEGNTIPGAVATSQLDKSLDFSVTGSDGSLHTYRADSSSLTAVDPESGDTESASACAQLNQLVLERNTETNAVSPIMGLKTSLAQAGGQTMIALGRQDGSVEVYRSNTTPSADTSTATQQSKQKLELVAHVYMEGAVSFVSFIETSGSTSLMIGSAVGAVCMLPDIRRSDAEEGRQQQSKVLLLYSDRYDAVMCCTVIYARHSDLADSAASDARGSGTHVFMLVGTYSGCLLVYRLDHSRAEDNGADFGGLPQLVGVLHVDQPIFAIDEHVSTIVNQQAGQGTASHAASKASYDVTLLMLLYQSVTLHTLSLPLPSSEPSALTVDV